MTEQYLIQKLTELRSLPAETEVVEFKEAKNDYHFDKIGKYFSALSNEANLKGKSEAWLVFGVEDAQKTVVGSNYRAGNRANLDSLKNEIANKTANRITFTEIYELNLPEGRVVMFQIPAAPPGILVTWEGHCFGRDGESLGALNIEEQDRIRRQTGVYDWSAEICEGATLADLDPEAIRLARKNFKNKNPKISPEEIDGWDDITFLNKAKVTINGKITRTAILLLGNSTASNFIIPSVAQITWSLRDKDSVEKDYEHFTTPFILSVDKVFEKIRNLKYRYLPHGTLFPEEVDQYEPLNIKEALSNCIAHQDYQMAGRITVTEREDGYLTFTNLGSFLPGSIHNVILRDAPQEFYRNPFLANATASLNMIDTIGSGIKRMYRLQSKRFFPLPDYEVTGNRVKVVLIGKQLDVEYARVLAQQPDLTLEEIILLDTVQKKKELTKDELKHLRDKGLIEGRKGMVHISAELAATTGQSVEYMRSKGVDENFIRQTIIDQLKKFGKTKRSVFEDILLDKLSDVLSEQQKKHRIKNMLQVMKSNGEIIPEGRFWKLPL